MHQIEEDEEFELLSVDSGSEGGWRGGGGGDKEKNGLKQRKKLDDDCESDDSEFELYLDIEPSPPEANVMNKLKETTQMCQNEGSAGTSTSQNNKKKSNLDLSSNNELNCLEESESESDNEEGFTIPAKVRKINENQKASEITLSDDDDDAEGGGVRGESRGNSGESEDIPRNGNSSENEEPTASTSISRYGLRRKIKVNYTDLETALDNMVAGTGVTADDKSQVKKEVLDIFSLTTSRLSKFIQVPDLVDRYTKCRINFMDGTDSSRIHLVTRFFEKCGPQFESIFVSIRNDEESYTFLRNIFKATTALSRLDFRYLNQEDAFQLLKVLKSTRDSNSNNLASLQSLKLVSGNGGENLRERHISLIADLDFRLQSLELGDSLWEDVSTDSIRNFLERQKSCLERLTIHGGFRGDTDKEKKVIVFPKMEALTTLNICPSYTFLSEIKNPYSKKARVITLGVESKEEPFKVAIQFQETPPNLRKMVLGNLIEIEELLFSTLRKMTEFRCGSYWNLSIRFPTEGSRKALMESAITSLQFPDALKDPSFAVKVSKHFPNLKKMWMFLPSVPVLRAFFKAFENSELEELYLKTQFDFESTMESCLLPNMSDVLRKSRDTETIVETLREYKHFEEYVRYHNVELPVEAEDLMEGHSAGIRALKNLKVLHLEHIPRVLLIPNPEDERKWYDHHCKFMSTTFGYERYPMNLRCHKEILALDLSEYIWRNIEIEREFTNDFYEAGFVDIPDVQILHESLNFHGADVEEDLFIPVQKGKKSSGAQVKIMPSMLLPQFKAKSEEA